jgi:hypothetical protein
MLLGVYYTCYSTIQQLPTPQSHMAIDEDNWTTEMPDMYNFTRQERRGLYFAAIFLGLIILGGSNPALIPFIIPVLVTMGVVAVGAWMRVVFKKLSGSR